MSFMRRLFGQPEVRLEAGQPAPPPTPASDDPNAAETATVRRIVERLEALPPDQARLIACASYVVTRAANADMDITDQETQYLEQALRDSMGLDEAQAVLVVEMAKLQTRAVGGTEDFLVTREFRSIATPEQCRRVLRACFTVAAIDGSITALESATVDEIASELGIESEELAAMRGEFTDQFAAVQAARRAGGTVEGASPG
jgi:tellurite resistance protein